jgi:glyoxylase-like metal-dependent hydrolase (beta-lactamase superfamily II)
MYRVDVLVQGYPGRSVCHGALGWSTIALLRGEGRVALVDVGAFAVRPELARQLAAHGVAPGEVTDILLTHAHWDHSVNHTLFPHARIWIGARELDWAAAQPPAFDNALPELYVQALAESPGLRRLAPGDEPLPGLRAMAAPGHTPGSLIFYLAANNPPVVFTGDAAKNRAELLSMATDMTLDAAASAESLAGIWALWRAVPGTLLVPGHDLTMELDGQGRPRYLGARAAGIRAWFGEDLSETTGIDLTGGGA